MTKIKKQNRHRVSYSQYSIFSKCPQQYKYIYIDKLATETRGSIDTVFGTAMHEVIQEYIRVMFNETQKKLDEIKWNDYLITSLKKAFKDSISADGNKPCTKEELVNATMDGIEILKWFLKRKNRVKFFTKKGWQLKGIEMPLEVNISNGLDFVGYLDIVLKHKNTGKHLIIDLKVTRKGWNKYKKSNKVLTGQINLYKKYYSQIKKVPLDKIEVEYIILKREINEDFEYPIPRISKFIPANGSLSTNKVYNDFMDFIEYVFDENGNRIEDKLYRKNPTKLCDWCDFNNICDKKNN